MDTAVIAVLEVPAVSVEFLVSQASLGIAVTAVSAGLAGILA